MHPCLFSMASVIPTNITDDFENPTETEPDPQILELIEHFGQPVITGKNLSNIVIYSPDAEQPNTFVQDCDRHIENIEATEDLIGLINLLGVMDWRLLTYLQGLGVASVLPQGYPHAIDLKVGEMITNILRSIRYYNQDRIQIPEKPILYGDNIHEISFYYWYKIRLAVIDRLANLYRLPLKTKLEETIGRKIEILLADPLQNLSQRSIDPVPDVATAKFIHRDPYTKPRMPQSFSEMIRFMSNQEKDLPIDRVNISGDRNTPFVNLVQRLEQDKNVLRFYIYLIAKTKNIAHPYIHRSLNELSIEWMNQFGAIGIYTDQPAEITISINAYRKALDELDDELRQDVKAKGKIDPLDTERLKLLERKLFISSFLGLNTRYQILADHELRFIKQSNSSTYTACGRAIQKPNNTPPDKYVELENIYIDELNLVFDGNDGLVISGIEIPRPGQYIYGTTADSLLKRIEGIDKLKEIIAKVNQSDPFGYELEWITVTKKGGKVYDALAIRFKNLRIDVNDGGKKSATERIVDALVKTAKAIYA